jgi:hypothetical protein
MAQKQSLPFWILVVSSFFALLGLIVSSTLYFSPQSVLKMVDLKANGVEYLIQMWAVRQFAEGFIFGFATYKKSSPMLTLAYIFFLIMNIGDTFVGIFQKDSSLIMGALVMCLIASTMLYFVNKQSK